MNLGWTGPGERTLLLEILMTERSRDIRPAPTSLVRIKYRSRRLQVQPGEYLIGRSRSCHVIIDDDLVSRKHARLTLEGNRSLFLSDLGSCNGVFLNGKRIGLERRVLVNNDIFTVGSEELLVCVDDSEQSALTEGLNESCHLLLKPSGLSMPERTETTNDLDLIGAVAERALQAGHPSDAEKLLEMHLRAALLDAQGAMRTTTRVRQKAFDYALLLVEATGRGEWFDYAIDLLCAEKALCSHEQFTKLQKAAAQVPCIDVRRLKRYISILRSETRTMAGIKMASLIDELAGQLERT
jgi:pSer/pThr/pTyr-binding forkhead associated (FHA) protein